jgi:hypothetical protein
MSERKDKQSVESLPPELISYLKEVHRVLRLQGYALSVSGMNQGRSRLGMVQELSTNTIELLIGREELLRFDDLPQEEVFPDEYFQEVQERLKSGDLSAPDMPIGERCKDLLTPLRVVYSWAWEVANGKDEYDSSLADSIVGRPVEIVGGMLDPLVDGERAAQDWNRLKSHPEDFEYFFNNFRFRVEDELRPHRIGGIIE